MTSCGMVLGESPCWFDSLIPSNDGIHKCIDGDGNLQPNRHVLSSQRLRADFLSSDIEDIKIIFFCVDKQLTS